MAEVKKEIVKISTYSLIQYAKKVEGFKNKSQVMSHFRKPKKCKEMKRRFRQLFLKSHYLSTGYTSVYQDSAEYYFYEGCTFVVRENTIISFY